MEEQAGLQATPEGRSIIESLDVSPKMKKKLLFVHENCRGTKFGLPLYMPPKGPKKLMSFSWMSFSQWALIFNIFYYLVKGMWRKAIVLLAMNIVISVVLVILFPDSGIAQAGGILVAVLCAQSAYSDLYRKLVKKEVFWW